MYYWRQLWFASMVAAVPAAAADEGDETLTVWCWDPNFNIYAMQQAEKIYQEDHPEFQTGYPGKRIQRY